jgi:hypothetical protein
MNRQLGGTLSQLTTSVVTPAAKPTINFLNFADFKGTFVYANNYALGGTSFLLSDVADLALHPDLLTDTTPATDNNFESTPTDAIAYTGGAAGATAPETDQQPPQTDVQQEQQQA